MSQMSLSPNPAKAASPAAGGDSSPPTYAAFSPVSLGHLPATAKQRSTILVHQKSPLLAATPPQVTRALAYSHPFLLPLNKLVGLLSWTTGDPWESFLLIGAFWAVVLYGDTVIRFAGPLVAVAGIIMGMYARRYSLLSSTGWTGEKAKGHKRGPSAAAESHQKSLEDIVDTLKLFTSRCNILLDPFIRLTDFLSTQRTATSATTRPALTSMFIRILLMTPLWLALGLPPLRLLTTRRTVLACGTVALSWHSRPARVTRIILWRSRLVRRTLALATGLDVGEPGRVATPDADGIKPPPLPPRKRDANAIAASLAAKHGAVSPGVRFTFAVFENQRRWLGIGWTSSLLAYERASWTDEHLNETPDKDSFDLPEVDGGNAKWRWVQGSEWKVEGVDRDEDDSRAWVYYDNKWRDGRRGQDGWGRYTRRRKWCRDAELVEVTPSTDITPSLTPAPPSAEESPRPEAGMPRVEAAPSECSVSKRRWFGRRPSKAASEMSAAPGSIEGGEVDAPNDEEDVHTPFRYQSVQKSEWGLGDEARMSLG